MTNTNFWSQTSEERQAAREEQELRNKNPKVGDLATFYVGSDSYAYIILEVTYFQYGKRAGQVKTATGRSESVTTTWAMRENGLRAIGGSAGSQYYYGSVGIGYAKDYRDPSF